MYLYMYMHVYIYTCPYMAVEACIFCTYIYIYKYTILVVPTYGTTCAYELLAACLADPKDVDTT